MSNFNLEAFMKKNQRPAATVKFAATKTLTDEQGQPLEWELRAVSTEEGDQIREASMIRKGVPGRRGEFTEKLDATLYGRKLAAASVVQPDLLNAALQDSYGVSTPEDLIVKMVPTLGEWNALLQKCQDLSGINDDFEDEVEEAKN